MIEEERVWQGTVYTCRLGYGRENRIESAGECRMGQCELR